MKKKTNKKKNISLIYALEMLRIKITHMALGLKIYLPSDHFNIFPVKQPCYKGA